MSTETMFSLLLQQNLIENNSHLNRKNTVNGVNSAVVIIKIIVIYNKMSYDGCF